MRGALKIYCSWCQSQQVLKLRLGSWRVVSQSRNQWFLLDNKLSTSSESSHLLLFRLSLKVLTAAAAAAALSLPITVIMFVPPWHL